MPDQPHSADYLKESRNFWWNREFLEMMSYRWQLANARNVLDVGCGQGHWSRCISSFLSPGCRLTGIDREARWIDIARKSKIGAARQLITDFRQGDAEHLPFPDETFDLVTCQTFLIHVKDPLVVLREMIRVLVPGGQLVLAEPNNIPATLAGTELLKPIPEIIALLEFQLTCERGKMNLGEGFNSCGPLVPGWLFELGIEDIQAYTSDKAPMFLPPYAIGEQVALEEWQDAYDRGRWNWAQKDALRYFLAGGGAPERFDPLWSLARSRDKDILSAAEAQTLRATFTPIFLLVSGRKKIA